MQGPCGQTVPCCDPTMQTALQMRCQGVTFCLLFLVVAAGCRTHNLPDQPPSPFRADVPLAAVKAVKCPVRKYALPGVAMTHFTQALLAPL